MKREKLLKSKGYNVTKIQNELFRELTAYLEKNKMNRTQLAKQLGVTKGYVSQVLNGDFDYKLSKLVEFSLAMGKVPQVKFVAFDEIDKSLESNTKVISLAEKIMYNQKSSIDLNKLQFEEKSMKSYKIV
ncbi:MAG: helix-turn-helix domain-containing protein [Salinivirgaceae bacterium]